MTILEDDVAALLKSAPGEPPMSLDADALLDRPAKRRGRVLAPLLVAAVVATTALAVAFANRAGHSPQPAGPSNLGSEAARRAAAVARVNALLDHAAMPPGATGGHREVTTYNSDSSVAGRQTWKAAGSVTDTLAYLRAHPPYGLKREAAGPTTVYYVSRDHGRSLQCDVVERRGTVEIRVLASAVWDPVRPAWSYVRGAVTGVDLTVVRRGPDPSRFGAPTVRRTLTGAAAEHLARLVNDRTAQRPYSPSCPGLPLRARDTLLFRTETAAVKVSIWLGCGSQASITEPGSKGGNVLVAGQDLDQATLDALGLPYQYGLH